MPQFPVIEEVRRIGPSVPYEDGAEDRILDILKQASNRRAGSSDLAAEIHDWATRYHFSQQRSNLLAPFSMRSNLRILEVGAGSGPITRCLGESGAEVIALEGAYKRAQAAAVRCADLPNVEVVCGGLEHFSDPRAFDLVVAIGVMEYAEAESGGSGSPDLFLNRIASVLKPRGQLILALENQLGVKYLAGGNEDHLGRPWVGLEDYPGPLGVRTWSQKVLSSLLGSAGFDDVEWLFPFPDYKLPRVILREAAFKEPGGPHLIDRFVRHHHLRHPAEPGETFSPRRFSERAFYGVALQAGLGPQLAPSFLALASKMGPPEQGIRVDPRAVLWEFEDERSGDVDSMGWVREEGGELYFSRHSRLNLSAGGENQGDSFEPVRLRVEELSFEQVALKALARHDLEAFRSTVEQWRGWNKNHPQESLDFSRTAMVQEEKIRSLPRGLVKENHGIEERYWRALWRLCEAIRVGGWAHPWMSEAADLVVEMANTLGVDPLAIRSAGEKDPPWSL